MDEEREASKGEKSDGEVPRKKRNVLAFKEHSTPDEGLALQLHCPLISQRMASTLLGGSCIALDSQSKALPAHVRFVGEHHVSRNVRSSRSLSVWQVDSGFCVGMRLVHTTLQAISVLPPLWLQPIEQNEPGTAIPTALSKTSTVRNSYSKFISKNRR